MATLTIRDLDEELRASLRIRAAQHGRSMEAEVRQILRDTLSRPTRGDQLGTRIRQQFAAIGGVELELPTRTEQPHAATLP